MTDRGQAKIVGIEFLRFVCAFAVLLWHYQHFAFTSHGIDVNPHLEPLYRLLKPGYNYGYMGVKVFWCISGFIFFFTYLARISRGVTSFREFFVNRLSRLYPLHALTLLIVAVLQLIYRAQHDYDFVYHSNDIRHFVLHIFFASDWWRGSDPSFNGPIWSVSVEIIVYFVFFVVVSRLKLGWAYASSILMALAAGILGWHDLSECLAYFFAGGVIAICRFFPGELFSGTKFQALAFRALGVLLAMLLVVASSLSAGEFKLAVLVGLLVICLVYVFVACNQLFLPLSRTGNFLGNLTYSSYLTHFPLQLLLVITLPAVGLKIEYTHPWLLFFFLTATLSVSVVAYRYFEAPMQKILRARFLKTPQIRLSSEQRSTEEHEQVSSSATSKVAAVKSAP
jgi:peptidoglycan/LPS O-acetylase OafA/YrhL